jgi:hypothetical protein
VVAERRGKDQPQVGIEGDQASVNCFVVQVIEGAGVRFFQQGSDPLGLLHIMSSVMLPINLSIMEASILFFPRNEHQALQWLIPALDRPLTDMPMDEFMKAWYAIGYLYGGLNPDEATDHGDEVANDHKGPNRFNLIEPRLVGPYYVQSGWPVVLAPLAREAWRRYEAGRLEEDELYCYELVKQGIMDRMSVEPGLLSTTLKS